MHHQGDGHEKPEQAQVAAMCPDSEFYKPKRTSNPGNSYSKIEIVTTNLAEQFERGSSSSKLNLYINRGYLSPGSYHELVPH